MSATSGQQQSKGPIRGETSKLPGMTMTDFWFEVPLDHFNRAREEVHLASFAEETIKVFVREVVSTGREHWRQPALLYLEGGPGFQAPRPLSRNGWLQRALEEYRVYLLDQRGCGLSSLISYETLQHMQPAQQAALLCLFRADSIVADCEVIRRELLGEQGRWTLLAQSYGGFVSLRYLSAAPEAIEVALFAGALPPIGVLITDIYKATYRRLAERNRRYYERYPMDVRRVREIIDFLGKAPVHLPGGGVLTDRRFLQLGLRLGTQAGFETLHFMLEASFAPPHCVYPAFLTPQVFATRSIETAAKSSWAACSTDSARKTFAGTGDVANGVETVADAEEGNVVQPVEQDFGKNDPERLSTRRLSPNFLHAVVGWQPFELQPLYTLLQEAIYMGDGSSSATEWAAHTTMQEFDEFSQWQHTDDWSVPAYFTGEMIYPWMFEGDYEHLKHVREASNIISQKDDWPILYDTDALQTCKVPCAAAVYYEDMYVESSFSEKTGRLLPNCKMWITNEYQHSGLQDDGYNIMAKLLNMVRGGLQIPS